MKGINCPKRAEQTVRVDVANGEDCLCASCDQEFTVREVRDPIASWGPVLARPDSHPAETK